MRVSAAAPAVGLLVTAIGLVLFLSGCAPSVAGRPEAAPIAFLSSSSSSAVPSRPSTQTSSTAPVLSRSSELPITPDSSSAPGVYRITGEVLTLDGVGVSGVQIGFRSVGCSSCSPVVGVSGSGGRYQVELPAGDYIAACTANGYACGTVEAAHGNHATYHVDQDGTVEFEVEVNSTDVTGTTTAPSSPGPDDPNSIAGEADAQDGSGVPGVTVIFRSNSCAGCAALTARTDSSGDYSLDVPPGAYTVSCTYPGAACAPDADPTYDTATAVAPPLFTVAVPYGPDGPQSQQAQTPTLSGHVLTPSGQPVAGATITLEPAAGSALGVPHTVTDASGAYSFSVVGGVYNAICESNSVLDGSCGGRGTDGGQNAVTLDRATVLDFIACPPSQYPACLKG